MYVHTAQDSSICGCEGILQIFLIAYIYLKFKTFRTEVVVFFQFSRLITYENVKQS